MIKKTINICCLFLFLASAGCGGNAGKLHVDVPLVWQPTNNIYAENSPNLTNLYAKKISVRVFLDKRNKGSEIGKYIEDNKNMVVTTKDNVADWSTAKFTSILQQNGFNVVEANPDIILNGEIMRLYVTEDKTYKANVGIKVTALRPSGDILWQGLATGSASRFGRSYDLETYYKSLSDACLEAVLGLLGNTEFVQALTRVAK